VGSVMCIRDCVSSAKFGAVTVARDRPPRNAACLR
jgi:hypothetical protein